MNMHTLAFATPTPAMAHQLASSDCGTPAWWQRLAETGIPSVLPAADNACAVTLLWRDPHGNDAQSPITCVVVDMNSVTDHHRPEPEAMARVPGTDVWYWHTTLPADWRGSYGFIPLQADQLPPAYHGADEARRQQQRAWWISIMAHAVADPFNPPSQPGNTASALHLPAAPDQSCWRDTDAGHTGPTQPERLRALPWHSAMLANQRTVWLFETGTASTERPLVILLDGQRWARQIPIWRALELETASGRLPAAAYLLIDSIDGMHRGSELGCNAMFWQAIQQELLPFVHTSMPCSQDGARTVVTGQSLGGLAALYAGWHWPSRFGRVLSQSGSFWWPHEDLMRLPPGVAPHRRAGASGELAREIAAAPPALTPLAVLLEVGSREDVMIDVNEAVRDALLANGHHVQWQIFEGGHDSLCWRGGLIDGLARLLASTPTSSGPPPSGSTPPTRQPVF
ncbi:Enterochelin esterase [Andreprevotia sp. IGB-42]|uniref:enterochelin esterase n=1 Tax=Andreprevotia sp. IGB-42 TaxID=2497473 RepID=UPI00157E970A|nr:enterochelin esterase [Andreprevotia sp. IGB-42]KAF0812623.1 Enterochelin esterase [Andreprevotia sp. IGB-42]